eukprot:jgi/Picsp_1/6/NSC_00006-R1_plastid ribosomal protein l35
MQSALSARLSGLRIASPAPLGQNLCSKMNGIAGAAQRVSVGARQVSHTLVFSRCVEVECADGRRGGKLKTRKAAAKRFKVTGSGKVTVRHAGKNHFQEKKSGKRKQKLSMKHVASDTQMDNIKGCLPYAKIQ